MSKKLLESTDSARSARPLPHAQSVTLPGPLELERGGRLEEVTVCFETYGKLDSGRGNAVLVSVTLSAVTRTSPATGRLYGRHFPTITIGDMVEVQHRLLRRLGIRELRAVIGGSMGGQQVLEWARQFPGFAAGCIALQQRRPALSMV